MVVRKPSIRANYFSDEKLFSLEGSYYCRAYVQISEVIYGPRHQQKGGGIMVWVMIFPNGLLSFKILNRDFKSLTYIDLLCQTIVPIYKLNYEHIFRFHQDKSKNHTVIIVKEWKTD